VRLRSYDAWAGVAAAFVVPLVAFLIAAHPGVDFWDSGEMQTVPYILGIAHPTGFPAFTLLGWLFSHAFPVGNVAWRMTVMCALAMALAAYFLYRAGRELDVDPASAAGAALVFAFGPIVWTHASRTEVHAPATMFAGLLLWLAVRWRRAPDGRLLAWAGLIAGLAVANHTVAVLLFPGLLLLLISGIRAVRFRELALGILLFAVGLSLYAYLPIRSAIVYAERKDPTLALGIPPGRPFWDNDHPSTFAGFRTEVSGSEFAPGSSLAAILSPRTYAKLPDGYGSELVNEFGPVALALALGGVLALAVAEPLPAVGLLLAGFLSVPFALGYPAESDIERYFLPSFWIVALFAAVGTSRMVKMIEPRYAFARRAGGFVVLGFLAALTAYANRGIIEQRYDDGASRFIAEIRARTPPNAIVVASWNYATPLAYGAYVEHSLGDRIIVVGWPTDYESLYFRWLRSRPIFVVSTATIDLKGFATRTLEHTSTPIVEVLR
jgi:4-amino-4-deoxy-L-arabinose transferase-like glycosyltransferase